MLLVCALAAEERAARRGGAEVVRVGLGATGRLPAGGLVSFGLAGALVPGLEPGALVSAARIVDEEGVALWTGQALPIPGARIGTVCAAERIVDDPGERSELAARTGADVVDLESGALAASGRLLGAVRATTDGPARPLGLLARAATPSGEVAWSVVAQAFVTQPRTALRAASGGRRGLRALERAAAALAQAGSQGL